MPLPPPSLNKYAFLTGLKSHAVKTWMLKILRASRIGAKRTTYRLTEISGLCFQGKAGRKSEMMFMFPRPESGKILDVYIF